MSTQPSTPSFDGPQIGDPDVEMAPCLCCVAGRPRPYDPATQTTAPPMIKAHEPIPTQSGGGGGSAQLDRRLPLR